MRIQTKKHRLPEPAYHGEKTVSFTACEATRRFIFVHPEIVETFVMELGNAAEHFLCDVPVYCFMPDHLHVIVSGREQRSRPKKAMEQFKHRTGNWLKRNRPEFEWQDDFHDHIIRQSDDWRRHVQYVAANPVRAGLVEDMLAYPFTGSIGCDLNEVLLGTYS